MHLIRSQWAVVIALSVLVIFTFVGAAVLHHRIEHPTSGSLDLHNLNQPVRTVVVASDWDVTMVVGHESQQYQIGRNQSVREGIFFDTLTSRSVELYCPTGTDGLFERYVTQRGDTLFFQKPDSFFPLQVRLNLPPSSSLTIINQGQVDVRVFSAALNEIPVGEVDVRLSGTASLLWYGTRVPTMTVSASDYARLNYYVNSNWEEQTQKLVVNATDRSTVEVKGALLKPDQVDVTLADEAALIYRDHYTATRLGTVAHD
ncbi:MAG: hypothetical protein WA958_04630 [Tunicatimonas sp.]